jgi:hypothetical protein
MRCLHAAVGAQGAEASHAVGAAVIVFCASCKYNVGGYTKRPTHCSYCSEPLPDDAPVEPEPVKLKPYKLSENDRTLLRTFRIDPEV